MDGKIALEEHWAIQDTLGASEQLVGSSSGWGDIRRRLLDIHDERLREMDSHGIELTILSLNAPAIQAILDPTEAIETSRKANDIMVEQAAKRPDRFRCFAALPMQDVDAAILELQRCVTHMGFAGALVNGFTQKDVADSAVYFDIPQYRPFWEAVEELDVPFYLHPRTQIPARMQSYEDHPWLISASWGFARETSIHALRLIGSGLFDAHPRLKIILGHLGERIPYDMWRLDHRIRKLPKGYPCKKEFGDYLRENFYLTTSGNFHDPTLNLAITELGMERVLFSVDYPYEDTVDAVSWFDNNGLSKAARTQIGRQNAIDLFGLDLD
ncbi:MAG: amidohydrolase family protein [Pseudomonadota bacterium]|nr:amidohydrolase family protein [Pseudomonadota bacterium]